MSEHEPGQNPSEGGSTSETPRRIGRYAVKRLLGHGGMGRVFYAEDTELDRPVALKVIHPHLADTPAVMERFRLEARAVARLNHPNIVQIYEFGQEDGLPFFAMEYVDGISLTAWLRKSGPLTAEQALRLILAASRALDYARQRDVIHRDVKPENMLISREGRLKLVDFGLAKCLEADSELTQSGTVIGSPYYMSPEQSRGEKVDHRTDIYSLGISLYHMLTGSRPFDATSPVAILLKHVTEPLPEPPELQSILGGRVLALVKRMTAKEIAERYADYDELTGDLRAILRGDTERETLSSGSSSANTLVSPPPSPTPVPDSSSSIVPDLGTQSGPILPEGVTIVSPPRSPWHSWIWGAIVGVVVAAIATGILWRTLRRDGPRNIDHAVRRSAAVQTSPTATPAPLRKPVESPTAVPSSPTRRPRPVDQTVQTAFSKMVNLKVAVIQRDFAGAIAILDKLPEAMRKEVETDSAKRQRFSLLKQGIGFLNEVKQAIVEAANRPHDPKEILRHRADRRPCVLHANDDFIALTLTGRQGTRKVRWSDLRAEDILLMGAQGAGRYPNAEEAKRLRVFAAAYRIDTEKHRLNLGSAVTKQEKEVSRVLENFIDASPPPEGDTPLAPVILPEANRTEGQSPPALRRADQPQQRPTPLPRANRRALHRR